LHDWPELLASYRRRAAREKDATERASLLIEIASLQEEKLVDLDGAAATYHEALVALPGQLRALRALARIEEARGDWESLVDVLAQELAQTPDGPRDASGGPGRFPGSARFQLLMRIGVLAETSLARSGRALAACRGALAATPWPAAQAQAVAAIVRLVLPSASPFTEPPTEPLAASPAEATEVTGSPLAPGAIAPADRVT